MKNKTFIYAIDVGSVYEVNREDEKWFYCNDVGKLTIYGNKMERTFSKKGGDYFHIVSSDLAKQLQGKTKTQVIKLFLSLV